MSTRHTAVIFFIAALATGCAHKALTLSPEPTNTPTTVRIEPQSPPPVPSPVPEPLRLKLTLTDGTQVIGVPSVKSLAIKTSFADMQVPFERVRSATFSKDRAEIILLLSNGDRMTAAPKLADFQLSTIFGKINVESRLIITITVLPGGRVAQWPRDGLWGYWPLNGDAKDASGNDHDGLIKGAKPTEGVRGQAYAFDGNASIELGNPDFPNEEYTVAGWIRTDCPAQTDDYRTWIDKLDNTGGPFMIGIGDGRAVAGENDLQYCVWKGGETLVNLYPGKVNLRNGQWHHCAITYKKGTQKVFVDGALAAEDSYSSLLPTNSSPIAIGGHRFGSYHHRWIGDVAEVFIYQRALTDNEVQSLCRHGQPSK